MREQEQLDKYNRMFRKIVREKAPKHNCMDDKPKENTKKKVNNSRFVVQMELRAKSEPKEYADGDNSAH